MVSHPSRCPLLASLAHSKLNSPADGLLACPPRSEFQNEMAFGIITRFGRELTRLNVYEQSGSGRARTDATAQAWKAAARPKQWSINPPIYLLVSAEEQKPFLSSASFFFCHSQWPTRLSLGDHLNNAVFNCHQCL